MPARSSSRRCETRRRRSPAPCRRRRNRPSPPGWRPTRLPTRRSLQLPSKDESRAGCRCRQREAAPPLKTIPWAPRDRDAQVVTGTHPRRCRAWSESSPLLTTHQGAPGPETRPHAFTRWAPSHSSAGCAARRTEPPPDASIVSVAARPIVRPSGSCALACCLPTGTRPACDERVAAHSGTRVVVNAITRGKTAARRTRGDLRLKPVM